MKTSYRISVRDLVEQIERSGDINFRFSSRSNAMDGIRGHQKLQKSRSDGYLSEVKVTGTFDLEDIHLEVGGRVDGYYPDLNKFIVEEIKTIRVDVARIPMSILRLYWGQVKIYACLLARIHEVKELTIRLSFLDLDSNEEHQLDEEITAIELESYYEIITSQYISFIRRNRLWIEGRDKDINTLKFPYDTYRPGQREMAVSVYKNLKEESQLVLQAPTGIGKSIASIFPSIKALPELAYEKIFFLSAKASGQLMAQNAIQELKESGLRFRDITITAKAKICFTKGAACDAEQCEYARGYYDKLPILMDEVLASEESLTRAEIEHLAKKHTVCPFELSLDLSLISDLVICDYNYIFDPVVYLKRYFDNKKSKYALLMDESHNLVDRGRDMFSAEITKQDFLDLKSLVKSDLPLLAKRLNKVNAEFLSLIKKENNLLEENATKLDSEPEGLLSALRKFVEIAEDWLQINESSYFHGDLLKVYFDTLRFLRTNEYVDVHYCYLLFAVKKEVRLKIYCLNPAPKLAEGFDRVTSSICFSATMNPQSYFHTLMGVSKETDWYQIEPPFPPENLGVYSSTYISTTYNTRTASIYELVDSLATILSAKKGNYIVYFPSYAYMSDVRDKFIERHSKYETIAQSKGMSEEKRVEFLDAFVPREDTLLGFAVMGGVFGEGINLVGERLIGAIIVGVGLPQLGLERNLIRDYFDEHDSRKGFEFAYQYPGINRVLQTAGRVIRSDTDKGIVCLFDLRFNERRYQELLPASWQMMQVRNRQQLEQGLVSFWKGKP
ncbi:MAG: DNA excision repair protein ERCC-2 [Candidatus Azotimanducaceae bacterium]